MNRLTSDRPAEVDSNAKDTIEEITRLLNELNNCDELIKLKNISHEVWKEKNVMKNKRKTDNTSDLCPISPSRRQRRKVSNKTF